MSDGDDSRAAVTAAETILRSPVAVDVRCACGESFPALPAFLRHDAGCDQRVGGPDGDGLRPFPFPLPRDFAARLGYDAWARRSTRVSAALARVLAQLGEIPSPPQEGELIPPPGARRFLGLWWERGGDEVAFDDGRGAASGMLDNWPWLDVMRAFRVAAWELTSRVSLGSSEYAPTHWLVFDRWAGQGYVAPVAEAIAIVRAQRMVLDGRPS